MTRAAGAALAAGAVTLLAFAEGGYWQRSWHAAALGFAAAAAIAVVARRRLDATRAQWLVVGSLAALAGWTALSGLWSPNPAAASLEAQRTLVYVAAAAAAIVVAGRLLTGTLVAVGLVCAYALGERLLNGPSAANNGLLHEPIGYPNGLGALAAIGVAAAVGGIAHARRADPRFLALIVLGLPVLVLTESRGGWLAALAGGAVAVALGLGRLRLARIAAGAAGAVLAAGLAIAAAPLADEIAGVAGHRSLYWHVAWEEVARAPLAGRGAGTFELAWVERGPAHIDVLDAHSLYLEALAELGLVGLALVLLVLAPPLAVALRGPVASPAAAAAAGAYAAFLLHAGLDWDWELPAITVAGLFCGAALLQERPSRGVLKEVSLQGASP